jgi:hypothetical protein
VVQEEQWRQPLYWLERDGRQLEFTLYGPRERHPDAPVCHLSGYEADAFASWAGARLPTEFEWEHAAAAQPFAGNRFDASHSIGVAALYKTTVYCFFTFLVLWGEKMFHAYRESGMLGEAFMDVWAQRDRNVIFAKVLCIGLAFMGYHLFKGIDRRLGEGTLKRLVFNRP